MRDVMKHYLSRIEQAIANYANEDITESSAKAMIGMLEAWEKISCMLEKMR